MHSVILKQKDREHIIDWARALTIILMVTTHVIALLYKGNDSTVYYLGLIGGITSFTSFLFLSGVSIYLSYLKEDLKGIELRKKNKLIISRNIRLIIIYFLLSIVSQYILSKLYLNQEPSKVIDKMLDIFTFATLTGFTEFLPTLAIFSISVIMFKKAYKGIFKNITFAILISIITYIIGTFLVGIDLNDNRLNTVKSIFFGHINSFERIHSFPIFQYFPVFVIGIIFGKFLVNNESIKKRREFLILSITIMAIITFTSLILFSITKRDIFYPLADEGRFPPSISFITLSLGITFSILLFLLLIKRYLGLHIKRLLNFIGKNAISLYSFHILIIFILKYLFDNNSSIQQPVNLFYVLLYSFLIIVISSVFTIILNNIFQKINLINSNFLNSLTTLLIISISIFILWGINNNNNLLLSSTNSDFNNLSKKIIYQNKTSGWWDDYFQYRRPMIINNDTPSDLSDGQWISFKLDHEALIKANKVFNSNGSDIRIVYEDINKDLTSLPIVISNSSKNNAEVSFQLVNSIISKKSVSTYVLYYGNKTPDKPEILKNRYIENNVIKDKIQLLDEQQHPLKQDINAEWFLKSPTEKMLNTLTLTVRINTLSESSNLISEDNKIFNYTISKSDNSLLDNATGGLKKTGDNIYSASPNISSFKPGEYTIQSKIIDVNNNFKIYISNESKFKISYPLYVTWTFDWEGWDVQQYNLNAMSSTADQFNIPMTQLFNPRIFIKNQIKIPNTYNDGKVPPDRASYLTNWIKSRQNLKGDEIGMHMHMFADMVTEAGVTPRSYQVIQGAAYGDIMTSSYSQGELEKIFKWGITKMQQNNLPTPITYRTGGWFSNLNVLNAEVNSGFLIDSSGRSGGRINPNSKYSSLIPWNLASTTRPYKPSINDINKWDETRINIFELPNNGADSYWFSANDLIKRFTDNNSDPTGIIYKPQVLTYLTHPHWYTSIDQPKIKSLFSHISNFLYSKDSGPVVYTTLGNAYSEWDKTNLINGN